MRRALVLFILFIALAAQAEATLKAQFEKTLDAQGPEGIVKADVEGGAVIFIDGRISSEKAAHVDADTSISYPLNDKYYNVNSGMLSFWFRPCGWGNGKKIPGEGNFQPLMAFDIEGGHNWTYLSFFSWNASNMMKIQVQGRAADNSDSRHFQTEVPEAVLKPDTWNQIVLIWNSMEFTGFINGEKIGSVSMGLPTQKKFNPKWKLWFCPRKFWKGALKGEYDISGFELTDTIPSAEIIKREYLNAKAAEKSVSTSLAPVPLGKTEPQIDGVIEDNEWADATELPIIITHGNGMMAGNMGAQLFLKHDDKNFYYALKVLSQQTNSTAEPDANDMDIYSGTGCVLDFWWKLPNGEDCQLGVAPNGAWAFRRIKKWEKLNFKRGGHTDENGWYVECAVPFSEMGIASTGVQEMNFSFTRPEYMKSADNRWLSWNVVEARKALSRNFGMLDLRTDGIAIRMRGNESINIGKVAFMLEDNADLEQKIVSDVELSSNGTKHSGTAAIGNHSLAVKCLKDGKVVYNVEYKYAVIEPLSFEATCHAAEQYFQCVIDARGMDEAAAAPYAIAMLSEDGNELASTDGKLSGGLIETKLQFGDVPQGKYTIRAKITCGKNEYVKSFDITKPDDVFLKDRKGLENDIPWPFTAITAEANVIACSNIKYSFVPNAPLPVTAANLGNEILSEPMQITIQVNGKDDVLEPISYGDDLVASYKNASHGTLQAKNSKIKVNWTRFASYDGMLKYQFVLAADSKATVGNFKISAKIKAEYSRYSLSPIFNEEWETRGRVCAFPSAWLCGNPFGFTMFTDTDMNWIFSEEPLRMVRNSDGTASMTAHFIDKPTEVSGEVPYTLALMPTPSKSPRKEWRKVHFEGWGRLKGQTMQLVMGAGMPPCFKRMQDLSQPITENILKLPGIFAKRTAGPQQILPYIFLASLSDNNPVADWYGADWARTVNGAPQAKSDFAEDPVDGAKFALVGIYLCHNKTQSADFICYYLDKVLKDTDVYIGLYTDGGGVFRTDTPYTGMPDKPALAMKNPPRTWDVFGKRDVFERIYKIIRANRGPEGIMYNHNWETYYPAITSFHDLIFPGEEYMHSISRGMQVYIEDTPIGKWQSNYNSEVFGAGIQFLGQWRYLGGDLIRLEPAKRFEYTKPLLMMCLLHDTPLSGSWYPDVEPTWKLLDDSKVCDAKFIGYWQDDAMQTDNEHVKASCYKWDDKKERMIILGNLSRAKQVVTIPGVLVDAYTNEPVSMPVALDENFGFRVLLEK